MLATKRRTQSALIRRLLQEPQQFDFFQAVRLTELWLRQSGQALEQVLRFKNSVSLSFPASQIEALSLESEADIHDDAALSQDGKLRIHITPAFMGMLGVSGLLPYCYTGVIAAQIHFEKNHSGRAFLDSFSHRPMILFYRAWEKCRVEYRSDGTGADGFLPVQLALAGLVKEGKPDLTFSAKNSGIQTEVLAHYAALIRHRPLSASVIAGVLEDYFGIPVRLEQFVGGWETLRQQERTRLGGDLGRLNMNAMIGERYWRRDLSARLWIGPLTRAAFDHFHAAAAGGQALRALLALFAVPNLCLRVHLILRASEVRRLRLDHSCQLGQGVVLASRPRETDYDVVRYHIVF